MPRAYLTSDSTRARPAGLSPPGCPGTRGAAGSGGCGWKPPAGRWGRKGNVSTSTRTKEKCYYTHKDPNSSWGQKRNVTTPTKTPILAGDKREMLLHPHPFLAPAHLVSGLCLSLSNSSGTLMAATEPVHSTSTFTMTLDHHDSALTLVSGTRLMGRL